MSGLIPACDDAAFQVYSAAGLLSKELIHFRLARACGSEKLSNPRGGDGLAGSIGMFAEGDSEWIMPSIGVGVDNGGQSKQHQTKWLEHGGEKLTLTLVLKHLIECRETQGNTP